MKEIEENGKFYDIYENDNKLSFRIYGSKKEVLASFDLLARVNKKGMKLIWLVGGLLSPFYFMIVFFEALVISSFVFFLTVAITSGANVFHVMSMALVFSFVYTVGIGRLIRLVDPKFKSDKRKGD